MGTATIVYGGYSFSIVGDSFSVVDRVEGVESYSTIYLGTIPVSAVVENDVTSLVTIPQSSAEELQENVIGGTPILTGRIGEEWFTISRPEGTADQEIEYAYKGNLLKAYRFGQYTYM